MIDSLRIAALWISAAGAMELEPNKKTAVAEFPVQVSLEIY